MRDPRERLRDILDAIGHIERYTKRGRDAFEHDELIQSWVVRHLQIIGEAARALPEDVHRLAPEIPWAKMIGIRHILRPANLLLALLPWDSEGAPLRDAMFLAMPR